ncbi:MAG: CBS domain-containing protein [Cyanobacteria bacterium J06639_1]
MSIPLPQLGDAIERRFRTVRAADSVLTALAIMHGDRPQSSNADASKGNKTSGGEQTRPQRASCVLVVENERLQGIFTERDAVKLMAANSIDSTTRVADVMTANPLALTDGGKQTLSHVLQILRQSRIRHLPVLDANGRPTGLVTANSIRKILQPANLLRRQRVRDVMAVRVQSALGSATVRQLVAQMHLQRVSCTVVVEVDENGERVRPIGIVTERDLVRLRLQQLDFDTATASEIMSAPLTCLHPDDSLADAHHAMHELGVRRLVVAGDRGELAGILTQTSMLQAVDLVEMRGTIETLKQVVSDRTRALQASNRELQEEVARREESERRLLATNDALEREIVDRRWIERELFREKELAQVTLESIGDAVIATDERGRVSAMNSLAEEYTGWQAPDAWGRAMSQIFVTFDELTQLPFECATKEVLREGVVVQSQSLAAMHTRSGRVLSVESTTSPIRDRAGTILGTVTVFRDVSEARQLTRQLAHQARHDTLTGLLNRGEFERRLEAAIASSRHGDLQHVLCYMDLDQFKIVNDTCGHEAGDELLRQLTQLLRQEVRASDVLARLGGDEFGLLLFQCPLDRAIGIANQFRERVASYRFGWNDKVFKVGVSIQWH